MIIKNLKKDRISVNKKGKITSGIKVTNERGIEYPKAVDYFVIDDFPELIEIYGQKPKKMVLVFPTNEIEDFFQASYVLYGSNQQMIRKCDGEECIHRIKETITLVGEYDELGNIHETAEPYEKQFEAGEIGECICKLMPKTILKDGKEIRNPKVCSVAMYLKAFIVDYKAHRIVSPLCYLFYSGSENTASNIYSELNKVKMMMGRLAGIPFGISVEMIPGKTNAKVKYPIWSLQVLGSMAQLEESTRGFIDYKSILIGNKTEPAKQLTTNNIDPQKEDIIKEEDGEDIPADREELDPNYWVKRIQKLKTVEEVVQFEKAYSIELSVFNGEDLQKIHEAFAKQVNIISTKPKG